MDEQTIVKETEQVTVELADGSRIHGEVYLGLYEAHHAGRQRIGDLLNGSQWFIPVKTTDGTLLVNCAQIVTVQTPRELGLNELMKLGKQYHVRVRTVRGEELEGELYVELPEQTCRVKDYLNQPVRFFPLVRANVIVYLNRNVIVSVRD